MNVLLDTHVLIWWIRNSALLGKRAKALIRSAETSVWISAVSVWEISIRAALGRLDVSDSFQRELIVEMERSQFRPLPITFEHAFAVRHLPLHHGDPFDRLLTVQAQSERLTILTVDPAILAYDVPTLDASQ